MLAAVDARNHVDELREAVLCFFLLLWGEVRIEVLNTIDLSATFTYAHVAYCTGRVAAHQAVTSNFPPPVPLTYFPATM